MQGRELQALGVVVSLVFAGCVESPSIAVPSCGDAGCGWQPVVTTTFTSGAASIPSIGPSGKEIDILFVVDDTPGIAGVEANLVVQYSVFAQVFQALPLGAPPMHVAFVPATLPSSDCSPPDVRGAICGIAPPDQFLTVDYCGVDQNSSGSLGDTFACLGNFGAQGCGTSQPLEAARRALSGDPGGGALTGRASFVSPGARLQIVLVTAQDDASTQDGSPVPVSDYIGFFKSLTADPADDVLVSVIGPEGCPSGAAVAAAATPRLDEVMGAFGPNGVAVSICDPSLTSAFEASAAQLGILLKPPCLGGIKDIDPTQPGLQPDCSVYDQIVEADHSRQAIAIPLCDLAAPVVPCLSFLPPDATNFCQAGSWAISVVSGPDPVATCGPLSQTVRVTCVTCADPAEACGGL